MSPNERCDMTSLPLSVIVIGYNMGRELPRTIRSLSPQLQRGITGDQYEIILIDNGSSQPPCPEEVACWSPNCRLLRMGDAASVSPVAAINRGLAAAKGQLIGVFIDGARMASPGLLAAALQAAKLHPRPAIGTLAFHLGREVQMKSVLRGYNQAIEDRLLADIAWEDDPYRLFDVSVFAGSSESGWFTLPAETNGLFLGRDQWQAVGGFDPAFSSPGGGLVNLDTWLRICLDPDCLVIMLLGEATFHQVHGGVATNASQSPWEIFHQEYVRLRGCDFTPPTIEPLLIGRIRKGLVPSLYKSLDAINQD